MNNVQNDKPFSNVTPKIVIIVGYTLALISILCLPLVLDVFQSNKSINVLVFTETFSPETLARFTKKTGIAVNLTYAEIDEQVYAKFTINQGEGYDVVNISDYTVHALGNEALLHELDHKKIPNLALLDSKLLNQEYDPVNTFSMPHKWYAYGLVYNKDFFKKNPDDMSLDYIFKNPETLYQNGNVPTPYKVCMLDDGRDATFITAIYLFGHVNNLTPDKFQAIRSLLVEQKKWVEAYTVNSAQYFLFSDVTPIALTSSNYMIKILENSDRFAFSIPKEGSTMVIENLAIPKKSKRVDWAHQFIDFMLSDEMATINSSDFEYNSSNKKAMSVVDQRYLANTHLFPDATTFKRLFIPLLPKQYRKTVQDLWLAVGFA